MFFSRTVATRVDDWLLMPSPWPVLGFSTLYIYVVWCAGPAFMKNRQPYDIKLLMITYNLFQTLLSLWLFQLIDSIDSLFFVLRKK